MPDKQKGYNMIRYDPKATCRHAAAFTGAAVMRCMSWTYHIPFNMTLAWSGCMTSSMRYMMTPKQTDYISKRREDDCLVLKGDDGSEYKFAKARIMEMLNEKRAQYPLDGSDQ